MTLASTPVTASASSIVRALRALSACPYSSSVVLSSISIGGNFQPSITARDDWPYLRQTSCATCLISVFSVFYFFRFCLCGCRFGFLLVLHGFGYQRIGNRFLRSTSGVSAPSAGQSCPAAVRAGRLADRVRFSLLFFNQQNIGLRDSPLSPNFLL